MATLSLRASESEAEAAERGKPAFDVEAVRRDFPALHQQVHGHPLSYLDNAASSLTPRPVIDALLRFYERDRANVHRGVHELSQRATAAYEGTRETIRRFLGAGSQREIVFVRGATEAINLVAWRFAVPRLAAGDEILLTHMEHHANIVPWQMVSQATGARIVVAPVDERGELDLDEFAARLSGRTRVVAVSHVSNALGTVNPVAEIVELAHERGVPVLVDGAQAVPHMAVDVRRLGCDFYTFSGHKVFAPTGSGALYGKAEHLEAMGPWLGGGDMILSVSFDGTTYQEPPQRFEAGTPDIAATIGLGAAIDYLEHLDRTVGREALEAHEENLLAQATEALASLPRVRLLGTARRKVAVLSFLLDGVHPHDAGTILDQHGVAVRAGHHCAQPLMERYGIPATVRASFAFYNTPREVERLVAGVEEALEVFR